VARCSVAAPRMGGFRSTISQKAVSTPPSTRFELGQITPGFPRLLRAARRVTRRLVRWLMTTMPGAWFRRIWGRVALLTLAQKKLRQALLIILGLFRGVRLQDDRQNSATGVPDVANCLRGPAVNFQLIEVLAQIVERCLVLQATAHTIFYGRVNFWICRGHRAMNQSTCGTHNFPTPMVFTARWGDNTNSQF
jgi:hypothetical protein